MARRSLTGIQPSGSPHIGNLLAAIQPGIALQDSHECYYFIASYHSLTTTRDPALLRERILENTATWLAMGLDPDKATIWVQHDIPQICELSWILSCITSKSTLDKAHAFKDAVANKKTDVINAGLFTYPVLMAADILAFDSNVVPVGKDQKQHVEMARDMAQRFNHLYGDVLVVPEPQIREDVAVVPGLDGRKMSRSYGNGIDLWLPPKKLRKRIMSIKTDSKGMDESKDPDSCNVMQLYRLFASPEQIAELERRYRAGGMGYGHAKQELFEVMDSLLGEPREIYAELRANPDQIRQILDEGARKARKTAQETFDRVRNAIGL
jgi:tryptophanyl-tRNA synthetase